MLDKQYNLYLVDTGHFYSNREKYLHDMNCLYRRERNYIKNKLPAIESQLKEFGYSEPEIKKLCSGKNEDVEMIEGSENLVEEYKKWQCLIDHKRKKAKESKEKLVRILSNKVAQNELTDGKDHIRAIRDGSLNDTNVISAFDSALSRTIGIKQDELTDELFVLQVYYFDVFKDISFYGFMYNGEKYRYFTSSAGQIRKKKAVFIKESTWNRIEKTIMCGLTIEKINAKGGNNAN